MTLIGRRIIITCSALFLGALAAGMAAPAASAFTVSPYGNGALVTLTPGEAAAVHNAHVGGAVDAVTPGFGHSSSSGRTVGQSIEFQTGVSARYDRPLYAAAWGDPASPSWVIGTRR
ncbi:hypothetical protein EF294_13690 [Gordonia oryzae]|uniref:Lactococcin 972 family bacteriocin n=1 Tax=Gordonia oryzae TaxID=2487349 RepID=A0A3N4GFT9_9ACTN|nr:hypothetical protein [Gordonia oryzae]RPA59516.1 hypothetical protein EF294_13690 [Gordonia oryzae]